MLPSPSRRVCAKFGCPRLGLIAGEDRGITAEKIQVVAVEQQRRDKGCAAVNMPSDGFGAAQIAAVPQGNRLQAVSRIAAGGKDQPETAHRRSDDVASQPAALPEQLATGGRSSAHAVRHDDYLGRSCPFNDQRRRPELISSRATCQMVSPVCLLIARMCEPLR